jgi:hypothetical protein
MQLSSFSRMLLPFLRPPLSLLPLSVSGNLFRLRLPLLQYSLTRSFPLFQK